MIISVTNEKIIYISAEGHSYSTVERWNSRGSRSYSRNLTNWNLGTSGEMIISITDIYENKSRCKEYLRVIIKAHERGILHACNRGRTSAIVYMHRRGNACKELHPLRVALSPCMHMFTERPSSSWPGYVRNDTLPVVAGVLWIFSFY